MKTVYLCGPINKCSDAEATDWRELAKKELVGFNLLDPMRRDYRGRELEPGIAGEIVSGDKQDLRDSDILLAYCPKPSVGTSMEIFQFYEDLGKPVVIVHPEDKPSPWLIIHSTEIVKTFPEAFDLIRKLWTN
jgi:nucleoside 2-deoxyribosyltransferase